MCHFERREELSTSSTIAMAVSVGALLLRWGVRADASSRILRRRRAAALQDDLRVAWTGTPALLTHFGRETKVSRYSSFNFFSSSGSRGVDDFD